MSTLPLEPFTSRARAALAAMPPADEALGCHCPDHMRDHR